MSTESENDMFPMVNEEDLTFKKLAPMAEEIIMLSEVLKRNCILPSNSHPPVVITKNMSTVIDNCKFIIVDEEDLIFKKISPMAEDIMVEKAADDNDELIAKEKRQKHHEVSKPLIRLLLGWDDMGLLDIEIDKIRACSIQSNNYQLDGFEMKTGFGWWWLSQGLCEGCCWDGRRELVKDQNRLYQGLLPIHDLREEFEWKRSLFEIDLTFDINAFDLDKGTEVRKDNVSQEHMCKEDVLLNNNIGKQSGDLVEMPSEAVEQGMDDHVPDEIDGAKCEQVPNHVVNKGNLEVMVCKQVATYGGVELVDKERLLKRKRVYAE
ncbi:hypothetical protein Tco_1257304 [Tanacetum coccineum]